MKKTFQLGRAALVLSALLTATAVRAQTVSLAVINRGTLAFRLTEAPSGVGSVGVDNPTMTFTVGTRYQISNANSGAHPFELLGGGVLLSQFSTGSFEGDPAVAYVEDASSMTFTLTGALAAQMTAYRCHFHGLMTGSVAIQTVAVGDDLSRPGPFTLLQNSPNPFNPTTAIRYRLPTSGAVRLEVFNVLGNRVRVLVDEIQTAGLHRVTFDAAGLPTGTYLYRLTAGDRVESRQLMLVK